MSNSPGGARPPGSNVPPAGSYGPGFTVVGEPLFSPDDPNAQLPAISRDPGAARRPVAATVVDSSGGYGPPPGYGAPQAGNPYGVPQSGPYGAPQQGPYGGPPPPNPYGGPPGGYGPQLYGAPGVAPRPHAKASSGGGVALALVVAAVVGVALVGGGAAFFLVRSPSSNDSGKPTLDVPAAAAPAADPSGTPDPSPSPADPPAVTAQPAAPAPATPRYPSHGNLVRPAKPGLVKPAPSPQKTPTLPAKPPGPNVPPGTPWGGLIPIQPKTN